jgi:hypothetical protein
VHNIYFMSTERLLDSSFGEAGSEEQQRPSRLHRITRDAARSALWATLLGGFGGGFGAALMLATTQFTLKLRHSTIDVAQLAGGAVHRFVPTVPTTKEVGVGVAIAFGALLGSLLGRLTWHPARALPRLLFFSIATPAAWLFAQAFIIGRFEALPLAPFIIGALVYGLCVATAASIRPRRARI